MPANIVDNGEVDLDIEDGGAPYTHDDAQPTKPADKPAEKSDVEKRLEALEADLKAKDAKINELSKSERYWAEKARRAAAPDENDDEDDTLPVVPDEKPEKLLDELASEGVAAIEKRGYIKKSDVEKIVNQRLESALSEVTAAQEFDTKLKADFPDLLKPDTELFKRTQKHFRDMVELDPAAKTSRSAIYSAAKLAKQELDMENRSDNEERRRERIERAGGERGRAADREDRGDGHRDLGPAARQIVNNLSRFGVTEENYRQNAGRSRRG